MVQSLIEAKTVVLIFVFAVVLLLERGLPAVPRAFDGKQDWQRMGRNVALWAINSVVSLLVVIPVSLFATNNVLIDRSGWNISPIMMVLFDVIMLDFFVYWWHRFNHELPILWRFHQVHHHDRFLDVTTAVRFHFGEVILSASLRAVIIMLSGLSLQSVLIFEVILLSASFFQHSNIRLHDRLDKYLSLFVVTPNWHWMHHHAVRHDTDSHYGNVLTLWDRVFRSRAVGVREPAMKIGIEREDRILSLSQLIRLPFKP